MTDEVHRLTLQVRAPRGGDGGKIEIGHWCIADRHVVLCDEGGRPIEGEKRLIGPGEDPRLIAVAMMRARRRGPRGFNDRIIYPRMGRI